MSQFSTPIKPFPRVSQRSTVLRSTSPLKQNHPTITGGSIEEDDKSLNDVKLPELSVIESRLINKELETKRILVNFILFFVLRLVSRVFTLITSKYEMLSQLSNDYNHLVSFIYKVLQLLFIWNIGNGLYKVFKPQDDFHDLNLTPQQRQLLGLPQLTLTKLESTTSTANTISLSPIKTKTITIPSNQSSSTIDQEKSTQAYQPTRDSLKKSPSKPTKTPIASPMSSPSPLKKPFITSTSPKKPTNPLNLTSKPSLASNLKKAEVSTPTYIPSPKYYYRMDSPTKSRRV